eukprot:jgi/Ulvmu1/6170/UM028_0026.1
MSSLQVYWSFDGAHPALAEQHYLRTKEQNDALEQERAAAQTKLQAARSAAAELDKQKQVLQQHRSASPSMRARDPPTGGDEGLEYSSRSRGGSHRSSHAQHGVRGRNMSACRGDIAHVQRRSEEVASQAEKVLKHSLQLARGCDQRGLCLDIAGLELEPPPDARAMPQQQSTEHITTADALVAELQSLEQVAQASAADVEVAFTTACVEASSASKTLHESGRNSVAETAVTDQCPQDEQCSQARTDHVYDEPIASGVYSEGRYKEYQSELETDMRIRMQAGMDVGNLAAGVFDLAAMSCMVGVRMVQDWAADRSAQCECCGAVCHPQSCSDVPCRSHHFGHTTLVDWDGNS